jgi:hypothetical protein
LSSFFSPKNKKSFFLLGVDNASKIVIVLIMEAQKSELWKALCEASNARNELRQKAKVQRIENNRKKSLTRISK